MHKLLKDYIMTLLFTLGLFLVIYVLIVKWDDFSFKKVDRKIWGIVCPSNPYKTYSVMYKSYKDNKYTSLGVQHIMSNILYDIIKYKWKKTPNRSSINPYNTRGLYGVVDEVIFINDNNLAWVFDIKSEKFVEKIQLPEKFIKKFNLPFGKAFPHHTIYDDNPRNQ